MAEAYKRQTLGPLLRLEGRGNTGGRWLKNRRGRGKEEREGERERSSMTWKKYEVSIEVSKMWFK